MQRRASRQLALAVSALSSAWGVARKQQLSLRVAQIKS
jgi:hypothetical protein